MEITALLSELLNRVDRFEVGEPTLSYNNTLRGKYDSLPMTVYPAEAMQSGHG